MVPVPMLQQQNSAYPAVEELDPESLLLVLVPQQQHHPPSAAAGAAVVDAPADSPLSPLTPRELVVPAFLQVGLYSTVPQEMHRRYGDDVPLYKPFLTFVGIGIFVNLLLIGFALAGRRRRHDAAERSVLGISIAIAVASVLLRLLLARQHHHPTL